MPMVKGGINTGNAGTTTGRLRIRLPHYKEAIMQSFVVDVYEYNSNRFQSYKIGGYSYNDNNATWYNTSAISIMDSDNRDLPVRFGSYETAEFQCVSIGDLDTVWSYPQVVVRDYLGGHSAALADFEESFVVEFITTDLATYDQAHTNNQPFGDYNRLDNTPTIPTVPDSYAPTDAEANVQADWTATSGDALILNKPTTFAPSAHNHDGRYYTETEIDAQNVTLNETLAALRGWVPGFSNSDDSSLTWDRTEDALRINSSTDSTIGAVYKAMRVKDGQTIRVTVTVKGDVAGTDGLYLRLQKHDGNLPDGKTHISHDAANSSEFVQDDDSEVLTWHENGAISTDWVTHEKDVTITSDGYISFLVLNWTGNSTDSVWVKTPDIQIVSSPYLPLSGGTLTGNIVMAANATVDGVDISGLPTTFAPTNAEQNVNANWTSTSGDSQILNNPGTSYLTGVTDRHVFPGLAASGTQAKRKHIGRVYYCPRHWDTTWQNIYFTLNEETYSSGYVKYHLFGFYNGTDNQTLNLRVVDYRGPNTDIRRYKMVLGDHTDAGWLHSGQAVYYTDIYVEVAYYKSVKVVVDTLGHGITNTNPTSGAGITVIYTTPTSTNITYVDETYDTTYLGADTKIWNSANDGAGSGLDADTVDGTQASLFKRINGEYWLDVNDDYESRTGTWNTGTSSSWGEPNIAGGYAYNDGTGSITFTVPTGAQSCWISHLTWSSGGYVDVLGVQSDGGEVFLRRINTHQAVQNSDEGAGQHDGSTITFAGTSLSSFGKIKFKNREGRFHFTGIAFSSSQWEGTEGTGMIHPKQITQQGSGNGLDSDKLDGQQGTYYLDYNNFSNTPTIPTDHGDHDGLYLPIGGGTVTGDTTIEGDLVVGKDGTSKGIQVVYDDNHASGVRWNTVIDIGKTEEREAGDGEYPTYVTANGYSISFQANSDGVLFGMEEHAAGNYKPVIAWGDDTSDSPFVFRYNNSVKASLTHDGTWYANLFDVGDKTGTWLTSGSMSDAIGWNTSYGTYIGSNVGGTHYLRGNGTFTTGGNTHTLWHSGNLVKGSGGGLDADSVDGSHANLSYGAGKQYDFTVNGNADVFYPVVISGMSNPRMTRLTVFRSYTETAPSTWNNSTHKGGLTLDMDVRVGGWGGYPNMINVHDFGEIYSRICGGAYYTAHTMKFVIWLRGGTASYHIDSPNTNLSIEVNDNTSASNYVTGSTGNGSWYSYTSSNTSYNVAVAARDLSDADIGAKALLVYMPIRYNGGQNKIISGVSLPTSLDATTVDGINSTSFLRSDTNDSASGNINFSGAIGMTGTNNTLNGHLYYSAYDAAGNHYPHFKDGSDNGGTTVNWRQYYGSNYKNHTWTSDSSGNMVFDFKGQYKGDSLHIDGKSDFIGHVNVGSDSDTSNRDLYLHGSTANKKSRLRTTNGNLHIDSAEGHALYLNYYYGAATNIYFGNGNTGYCGTVSSAGILRMAGDVVAYYSFSDRRLKTNIKTTENNLDKILSLNPVEYTWKEGPREGVKEIGLIAQEVEEVVPEVVRVQSRHHDEKEEGEEYKQVDYEHLVSTLIGAMQEQQKQIDELKSQISVLNIKNCKCKK